MEINRKKQKNGLYALLFISPVLLGVLIFNYIPAVQTFIFSFHRYDGFSSMSPVGFNNYINMFKTDIETKTVFINTFLFSIISVPLGLFCGFLIALLLNSKVRGIKFFRVLIYLPILIPSVASGVVWKDIMDVRTGVMMQIFSSLGYTPTFFSAARTSLATLLWVNTWGFGGSMIIWIAAFKNIPESLYESAKLDGANAFKRLLHITIPMSTSMLFFNLVTSIIGSLQTFNTFVIAGDTRGRGVDDSLYFISVKIYDEAFTRIGRMGYACAYAFVLFAIIGLLTAITFKTNSWVQYMEDI